MKTSWYPETITVEIVDKDNPHRTVSVLPTTDNPNINGIPVINADWSSVSPTSLSIKTTLEKIQTASDYRQTYVFLDSWLADERVSTITHSSTALWLSLVETFVWWWVSPNFYLSTRTFS